MVSFDHARAPFEPYGFTCVRWSPSAMKRPDHHNEIELNLLHSGWVTYLLGGRTVRIKAGQMSMFWAAIPHQIIDYGPEPDYFVATLPLVWFLQCRLPERLVQPLLQGAVLSEPNAGRTSDDLGRFAQWVEDMKGQNAERKQIVLLEIEARIRRMALTFPSLKHPPAASKRTLSPLDDGSLNRVERMACFIAQHYVEKLTVAQIADAVGLHPNYAMNLFQKTFGTTLVDYLTQHRVSHAQRLLAVSDEKIINVALNSGFGSISRFNEAFRKTCGCSPREYRMRHRVSS